MPHNGKLHVSCDSVLVSSCLAPSRRVSSSCLVLSRAVLFRLVSTRFVSLHLASSHLVSFRLVWDDVNILTSRFLSPRLVG